MERSQNLYPISHSSDKRHQSCVYFRAFLLSLKFLFLPSLSPSFILPPSHTHSFIFLFHLFLTFPYSLIFFISSFSSFSYSFFPSLLFLIPSFLCSSFFLLLPFPPPPPFLPWFFYFSYFYPFLFFLSVMFLFLPSFLLMGSPSLQVWGYKLGIPLSQKA